MDLLLEADGLLEGHDHHLDHSCNRYDSHGDPDDHSSDHHSDGRSSDGNIGDDGSDSIADALKAQQTPDSDFTISTSAIITVTITLFITTVVTIAMVMVHMVVLTMVALAMATITMFVLHHLQWASHGCSAGRRSEV